MTDQIIVEKPELKGLNEADLAAFLKDNPDIFVKRPELLELITLSDGRGACLLYTSPSPRDLSTSRMPSSA